MKATLKSILVCGLALASAVSAIPAAARQEKVSICHNGKTLEVAQAAVNAHLGHGDTFGPCTASQQGGAAPIVGTGQDETAQTATTTTTVTGEGQFQAATGDQELDNFLQDLNAAAGGKLDVFVADLSIAYNVPKEKIFSYIQAQNLQPADVLMLLQLVKVSGKPFGQVFKQFKQYRVQGWAVVSRTVGVQPGTSAFVLLRQSIPVTIVNYVVIERQENVQTIAPPPAEKKGSKGKQGSKGKKGSKGKQGSKGKKGSKGNKDH